MMLLGIGSLQVGERDCAIARQRAGQAGPVLRPVERILARRERRPGVEPFIPEEAVAARRQRIAAGSRDDVDDAGGGAAELRDPAGGHDLKLTNDVLGEVPSREPGRVVVGREAVNRVGG